VSDTDDTAPTIGGPIGGPIATADYHTAGEPFRIVTGGVVAPGGATMLDRRAAAIAGLDHVRAFLINEPRGHADMYGCFVTPADDDGAAFGLVFFHKDGFSTACGHGTIAAVTWALESGLVAAAAPVTHLAVDVPSGRLAVEADVDADGRVGEVRFTNVASWVAATGIHVDVVGRWWNVDVSFGGAFYASVRAADGSLAVRAEDLDELTAVGRAIKRALDKHRAVRHPDDDRLSGCYGTIWWEDELPTPDQPEHVRQRNVTVFADGEVDRSPCGSGTSARLALLHHHGLLRTGELLRHEGIVGTAFNARVLSTVAGPEGRTAVITQVGGRAHRTGTHVFTLDPSDEIGLGFQLR
jgi:proline racemase